MTFGDHLQRTFGDRAVRETPLAAMTTFKVGGEADWFVHLKTGDELRTAVQLAREHGVPITVLGGGSNVLIADEGIRGVVLRVHGGEVERIGPAAIRADAGVTINGLVRWTLTHAVAGLEA